jgi:glucosamine kinase
MTVIGIDIGGSKTHGVRYSAGAVVREAFAASANIASVGIQEAGLQLRAVATELGRTGVQAICVGAAGVDAPEAERRLHQLVQQYFPAVPVRIVHDTQLVLAAAGLTEGAVLISGTGSAAWGRNADGVHARAGGWGYVLGDEGGAYGVTRAAVRHALHRNDEGLPVDRLTAALLRAGNVTSPADLLERFYREPAPRAWAARARLVFDLALVEDEAALAIVDAAVTELVQAVTRVCTRLDLPGPVVLAGGLALHQPLLLTRLRAALAEHGLNDVRILRQEPVHGAVTLALTQ